MKPSSLLRLKLDLLKIHCMVANSDNVTAIDDANETDKGDHWISTESGSHVLLDGEGNIKGGMGGKFSGLNMSDVKKKDGEVSHASAISGAQKIHDKAKKEYDTQKREHPNWAASQLDFEQPVNSTHKSDPADLFSTKGAAHTSHEFQDAEHAENYTNDIHSKLINAGYKESYGAGDEIRYTKGNHVYVVDHNLNDTDNEDSFNVTVKSGYIDSSLAGSEPIKKVATNAERDSAKPTSKLDAKHEQTANELAKQKTEWSGGSFEDNLASAKDLVKRAHEKYSKQSIKLNPELSIKDVKEGDEISFPRDGIQGGFNGIVKKIYRTKMDVETDYMGKPMLLEKKGFMKNGVLKRGDDLIFADKDKFNQMKTERERVGIDTDGAEPKPQPAPEAKPSAPTDNKESNN